jgi:phosphatidylserine/phosphatidylglycerophosphate/cardiolipin synthase-like enzyme
MDLTTLSGDRWDTPPHPLRAGQNWHDVQLRVEGEAVADVEQNFRQRWEAVTHDNSLPHCDPRFDSAWKVPAQVVRTVPARNYDFAKHGEFGIFHWYAQAFRRARRFIYIENQYIWSPHIMRALLAAIDEPRDGPFRIVIVLPAFAGDGRWDNDRHVQRLRKADHGRGIVSIYSLYASGPNMGECPFAYRAIYVHAKTTIIDDEWLAAGSANLNNRGLITDGEIDVVVREPGLARRVRQALWAEHLGLPLAEVEAADAVDLADHAWTAAAGRNAEIMQHGEQPLVGALHRYVVGHKPSDLVLEDAQSLTFEH